MTATVRWALASLAFGIALAARAGAGAPDAALPGLLPEIDAKIRQEFWDPNWNGADWNGAVARAASELLRAKTARERDDVYDRLLATLDDSHTFRMPAGFPEKRWATPGLRIGRDGDGYAVKGVLPGYAAEAAGMRLGDRILTVAGRNYGAARTNIRELFFVLEGPIGSSLDVTWRRADEEAARGAKLRRDLEEPGDALVWKSARVIERGGAKFGYIRLWGISAETALAVVDLLLDRDEASRAKPELEDWSSIEGVLLDVRGNSGGYDPDILTTFLSGQWSAEDYLVITRQGKRVSPPAYRKLPVVLLVNSGTASAGEALALKFRTHGIGPIIGEETAGMLSGGAAAEKLSDGSTLWLSRRAIRDLEGRSYEGCGIVPDVSVADRPGSPGEEDAVIAAGIASLSKKR